MTNEQNRTASAQFIFKHSRVLAKDAHLFYSYELGIKEFILIFQSCEECILQQNPLQSGTK